MCCFGGWGRAGTLWPALFRHPAFSLTAFQGTPLPLFVPMGCWEEAWTQLPALSQLLKGCFRNNICSPYYGLQDSSLPLLTRPPLPLISNHHPFPSAPAHWPSSLSLTLPSCRDSASAISHSGKCLLKLSHVWASFPLQSGLQCHLFTEVCPPSTWAEYQTPTLPQSAGTGSLPGRMHLS